MRGGFSSVRGLVSQGLARPCRHPGSARRRCGGGPRCSSGGAAEGLRTMGPHRHDEQSHRLCLHHWPEPAPSPSPSRAARAASLASAAGDRGRAPGRGPLNMDSALRPARAPAHSNRPPLPARPHPARGRTSHACKPGHSSFHPQRRSRPSGRCPTSLRHRGAAPCLGSGSV